MVDIQREMVAANVEIGERLGSLIRGGVDRDGVLAEIRRLQSMLACQAAEFESLAKRYRDLG